MFGIDQALLAGAGVHQQADSQRKVSLAREVLDLLFLAVFVDLKVALLEVADQRAALTADAGQDTHQVYVYPNRLVLSHKDHGPRERAQENRRAHTERSEGLHNYNVGCLRVE